MSTTRGFDGEVCIGVPVCYPVAPPPTAVVSANDSSPNRCCLLACCGVFCFLVGLFVAFTVCGLKGFFDPRFKIESISVALDKSDVSYNQTQAIRATWDIGFSAKFPPSVYSVSVRCLSSSWSSNLIRVSTNHAVVTTWLPREFVLSDQEQLKKEGLTLQFDVLFRTEGGLDRGECKNMSIVIPPNQTQGFLVGGPTKCRH